MERGRGADQTLPLLTKKMRVRDYNGPPLPPETCPRCQSDETKFCYFNNYSVAQPRYLCKVCKRHWTQGGVQREIPIGGRPHRKRFVAKRENLSRVAVVHPPSELLQPPYLPPTIVSPVNAVIPPPLAVTLKVPPYHAGGGFLPPMATKVPQPFQTGYLGSVKDIGSFYNTSHFLQPTARYSDYETQRFLLNNNGGASSSNVGIPLNTTVNSATIDGGWGTLLANQNEWLDFSRYDPSA